MMHELPNDHGQASPFDGPPTSRGRMLRVAVSAVILISAVVLASVLARDPAPADETGHDHATMGGGATGDSAMPVRLSRTDAERIGVTYAVVEAGALTREVRTVGQVTLDETRVKAIAPKIDGWVERLFVDATGEYVREGAPLMAVYSPMLVAAQEELLLARRLEADVAGGTTEAVQSARALAESARRRLAYWDIPASEIAGIERAGAVRRTLTLRSPAGGFVIEKTVIEGQKIMAGDALFRVADLSVVWLEGEVFEQDLAAVTTGRPVTATFESFPGVEWKGRIAYVYPTLDPETRTARVRVELPNGDLRLKPGMYATFRFTALGRPAALSVPRSAVLSTGERSLVFVRRADGVLEPREVRVGMATSDRIEVLEGVVAGETVVASATFLIDAESNLGSVLDAMGSMPGMDMPGMDMPAPAPGGGQSPSRSSPPAADPPDDPHAGHRR